MLIDLVQKQCGEERSKVDRFVERVVRRLDDTGNLLGADAEAHRAVLLTIRSTPRAVKVALHASLCTGCTFVLDVYPPQCATTAVHSAPFWFRGNPGANGRHASLCRRAGARSSPFDRLNTGWCCLQLLGPTLAKSTQTKRYVIFSIYEDSSLVRCGLFAKPNVGLPRVRPPVVTGPAARPNPATSTTMMASEMEVVTSMEDNMAFSGRTCIEVHGEDITPEEVEGWSASGKRIKQIMAGKENGESATITRQSRPKTRASFAKRVAVSVTKAARMPIDMPKEDTNENGGFIIMSVVRTAARVTKEEAKADTICTNATPDERRATLYSKVKALNIGSKTYEINAYRTAPDGTVKGVIRGIAVDDPGGKRQWERKMEAMQQQPDPKALRRDERRLPRDPAGNQRSATAAAKGTTANRQERQSPQTVAVEGERLLGRRSQGKHGREETTTGAKRAKKIQEANGGRTLRDENEKLKRRIAEQDATIKEINEKLTTLIAMQQQQLQQPTPAQQRETTDDRGRTRGRGGPESHDSGRTAPRGDP
ncbi:hypothetical protein HPB49_017850 [Dermacentor silvarum]|uniref:Uncharacterized protein n=1 Tax=Dermacentor silvarum TaxID=543639 RepID=A0ACB8DK72_DERSI|nr:hypothetical protein HPB49_017850 [Dermacentor silvarum]